MHKVANSTNAVSSGGGDSRTKAVISITRVELGVNLGPLLGEVPED